ncbi:hypothetical protein ACFV4N_09715 [Actinosynnema sp. NPDC059797]
MADALRIPPSALLPGPFRTTARRRDSLGTAPTVIPAVEAAMMRYNGIASLVGVPDREPVAPEHLRTRIERAYRYTMMSRLSDKAPLIPGMIADSWHLKHLAEGEEQKREAAGLQALVYRTTSSLLDQMGEPHLAWIAAERSMRAAEESGDPLLIANGAWPLSIILRHTGRLTESTDAPIAAADALRSRLDSPQSHSMYGALMLRGAIGAATLSDHRAVRDYLDEASRVAERTGDRNDFWLAFGPTNIAIHRVWLALELGDPTAAIKLADGVPYDSLPEVLSGRKTSHLITIAWAHYLRRHDREALDALNAARAFAPEQLLYTGRVHSMLRGMLRRERRSVKGDLRRLADFVGVAA